jgi:hypothetical protein
VNIINNQNVRQMWGGQLNQRNNNQLFKFLDEWILSPGLQITATPLDAHICSCLYNSPDLESWWEKTGLFFVFLFVFFHLVQILILLSLVLFSHLKCFYYILAILYKPDVGSKRLSSGNLFSSHPTFPLS